MVGYSFGRMAHTDEIGIPLKWDTDQPAPTAVNVFVLQRTPADELLVTFGRADAFVTGDQDQQEAQVKKLQRSGLPVDTVARVVMSLKTARELHQILGAHLKSR